MRDILICTVGTSLIANIRNDKSSDLYAAWRNENIKALVLALSSHNAEDRMCGAEINSISSILRASFLTDRHELIFLVSETEEGRLAGQILKMYFESKKNQNKFQCVDCQVIEGLTDTDVHRFRNVGLRNLVRLIGRAVRRYGSNRILINATGGYKAQISFAGMIGQALEIPVCYLYERFSEVIQLPPQPVSLDLTFWLDHADLFFDLEDGIEESLKEMSIDERFQSLIDEEIIDGRHLITLSSTGQLFHETFRNRFDQQRDALLPKAADIDPSSKKIRHEDQNAGKHKGLDAYLKKISDIKYVKEIYTHYYNPDLNEPNRFRKSAKGLPGQIEGIFSNAGATTKFDLITTATKRELPGCIADLNHLLAQGQF